MTNQAAPNPSAAELAAPLPTNLLPATSSIDAQGRLSVGGCDVVELAEAFGTPLFVYDEQHIRQRCREAAAAFDGGAVYAAKAFLCSALVKLIDEEGLYLDVASGGELHVALANGFNPQRIFLHGNNKSAAELRAAVEAGVGRIVVDNFDELDLLESIYAELSAGGSGGTSSNLSPIPILIRVTPGVEAHTHEYITTGRDDSKFGFTVSTGLARQAVQRAAASPALELKGIHAHIGSQVFRLDSMAKSAAVLAEFIQPLGLGELSVGGGLGVAYTTGETAPTIAEWGAAVKQATSHLNVKLWAEPGRAIIAGAALTLYRVGVIKELAGIRTYISVDGGISDNPRPVLYGSGYEAFLPRSAGAARPRQARVVGKHCESGDILVKAAHVPTDVAAGDILATPVTGAYGYAMASNYNKLPRPAVVFVKDGQARTVIRRETFDDLLRLDEG